jgi:hypothetical protein
MGACLSMTIEHNNKFIQILTLIDSGALQANYMDRGTLLKLVEMGLTPRESRCEVLGGLGG